MNEAPSTILIIDDDPLVCGILERYLSHRGYGVVSTQDGSAALELVKEKGVDLVMLDVRMPGESGLSVLASLRRFYPASHLPVVMMTGYGDRQGAMEAFELGADDYVTKPIDFPLVTARIQTRLRMRLQAKEEHTGEPVRPIGQILAGRYELGKVIGEGQFGVVHRAIRLADGLPVAIKWLRPQIEASLETLARFRREVETLRLIQHPHAVAVLEFDATNAEQPFLVMELLEGRSLARDLREAGRLTPRCCARIVLPVCEVLAEVHEKGIVHRDIKPQNIFLQRRDSHGSADGNTGGDTMAEDTMVKVLDFGIAKLLDDSPSQDLTREGIGPGTPVYMAPERYYEVPYDGAADIYSLGVMLHEMLVGQLPFQVDATHPLRVAIKHMTEPPPPLRSLDPNLPTDLEELVLEMLAKEPEQRPTARRLLPRLKVALGEMGDHYSGHRHREKALPAATATATAAATATATATAAAAATAVAVEEQRPHETLLGALGQLLWRR